jgi:hypothetical protein
LPKSQLPENRLGWLGPPPPPPPPPPPEKVAGWPSHPSGHPKTAWVWLGHPQLRVVWAPPKVFFIYFFIFPRYFFFFIFLGIFFILGIFYFSFLRLFIYFELVKKTLRFVKKKKRTEYNKHPNINSKYS